MAVWKWLVKNTDDKVNARAKSVPKEMFKGGLGAQKNSVHKQKIN